MKYNFLLYLFTLSFFLNTFAQETDIKSVKSHLEYLSSDDLNGRLTGTKGIDKAAAYIAKYFKSIGIKPYYESYRDTFYLKKQTVAYNVIGQIEGNDPLLKNEPLIIGAHYDHIGNSKAIEGDSIANGANDNASGTVAVMQLAKALIDTKPKRPILFVLFDAEEQGLLGSKYLAEKLKSEDVNPYVIFNIEMVGVAMRDKPQQAYLTGFEKSNFADIFNGYADQKAVIFLQQAKEYHLFKRSDNYPFFQSFEIPAHSVSTFDFTNYSYYHHVDDEAPLLNPEHIQSLVDLWAEPLLKIANHSEKLIKLNN
ncbi:M20/M25/M40 family metallo-hydrolase [Flavobacteriaceae bacterium 14752]|uniref:M20/M25/M40 family metallo-hydrolase n=1 Tax=Mesohalobacter salilacus TaxID=2491711 RepID=UPI000F63FBBC|nr:M20/M25/M40 family metallo-hydrolase [Flavobacteriaceae bacterium 14752]